jgi:hypothetical protein
MFNHFLTLRLGLVLVLKLAAMAVLYFAFFAPSQRPPIDPAAHIGGPAFANPPQ